MLINSLSISVVCGLTLANSLDPDQARRSIKVQTVIHSDGIPERFFSKS